MEGVITKVWRVKKTTQAAGGVQFGKERSSEWILRESDRWGFHDWEAGKARGNRLEPNA